MLSLLRKPAPIANQAERLRQAEVLLASFARANRGLFILDGSAIGTDPDRGDRHELDVYCVFAPDVQARAFDTARRAFHSFGHWRIICHSGTQFDGGLLTHISRRARVCGERRRTKR